MAKLARVVAAVGLLATGCTKSNPVSCKDGYCQDPTLPFCDVDGALSGTPQTCVAVDCSPGDVAGCRDEMALVCNATGDDYDLSHCDHGCDPTSGCMQVACIPDTVACGDHTVERCSASGELTTEACTGDCVADPSPHCAYVSPQFLPDACDMPASDAALAISTNQTVDTTVDAFCNGGIVTQGVNLPDICVVRYGTFSIDGSGSWRVTGDRVLAIVADDVLRVAGTLDVSSAGSVVGPGSLAMPTSGLGTERGGGAGFATMGGDQGGAAGTGGLAVDPFGLPYFGAGLHGGHKTTNCSTGGGSGGGAAMLVSCRRTVIVEGAIRANGRGGNAGGPGPAGTCIGGGGGAGGIIFLQGMDIRVSGTAFANGGGGGCGAASGGAGAPGPDGASSSSPASTCVSANGSTGGAGGTAGHDPGPGQAGSGQGAIGGGGGSVGFLQTFTPAGAIPTITPTAASPTFGTNRFVPTR